MESKKLKTFIQKLLKVGISTHFLATVSYTSDSTINNILNDIDVKPKTLEKVSERLGDFTDSLQEAWIIANQK